MEIAKMSEFLQDSFRKYQWREALLSCLIGLTEGFFPKEPGDILREIELATVPSVASSHIPLRTFLEQISGRNLIPMGTQPHSIFFLCSEQNFLSACFDWLIWSISSTREMEVGTLFVSYIACSSCLKLAPSDAKKIYSGICRLTEQTWSKWNLSSELKDILSLSKMLREDRKRWKTQAHRNRNRNGPGQECRNCEHLEDSQKCIRKVPVRESGLSSMLETKLIIPEATDAIRPLVRERCYASPPFEHLICLSGVQQADFQTNAFRSERLTWKRSSSIKVSMIAVECWPCTWLMFPRERRLVSRIVIPVPDGVVHALYRRRSPA